MDTIDTTKLKDDEEYQQANTAIKNVLTKWPEWKRDTLLSIFNLTIEKPEEEEQPQSKPAVEFEAGEWFIAGKQKCLRSYDGAFYIDPEGDLRCCKEGYLHDGIFKNCHPCEPDFEIVPVEEMEALRAAAEIAEMALCDHGKMNHLDEVEDSVKPSRKQELLDHLKRSTEIVSTWPEWAKGMLGNSVEPERVNVGHNDTPEDDAVGELIEYLSEREIPNGELRSIVTKARDQYERQQKPTIPQEVREFIMEMDLFLRSMTEGQSMMIPVGSHMYHQAQDAMRTLDRCEVAKPHPLTKVRELVECAAGRHGKLFHPTLSEQEKLLSFAVAARRELQEYDGEVGE